MDKIVTFEQFMTFTAGFLVLGGIVFFVLPGALWYVLGVHSISNEINFLVRAQTPWAASMGVLAFMFRERDVSDPEAKSYLWALLTGYTLAFVLAVYGLVRGLLSGFGWFPIVIFLVLGMGCGYFLREE